MAKVRVPVAGTVGKSVRVDPNANEGATIGRDLRLPDGTVPTLAQLALVLGAAATTIPEPNPVSVTLWKLIREVPANVLQVQNLATAGLVTRRAGGTWVTRELETSDGNFISISDPAGELGNPSIDVDFSAAITWGGQHQFDVGPTVWDGAAYQDVVLETRRVDAGAGLTGGGTLDQDQTLHVGAGIGIAVNANDVQLQHLGLEDLTDPLADRLLFWDNSAGATAWLEVGSRLSLTGTTLSADAPAWGGIVGTLADQTDLQAALDAKSNLGHTHDDRYYTEAEVDALIAGIDTSVTWGEITGTLAGQTDLQAALNAKANSTVLLGLDALTDPGADRILFWDDSLGALAWLSVGSNLSITGTSLDASGSGGSTTLSGLTDVTLTAPADGDFLRYDGLGGVWINEALELHGLDSLTDPNADRLLFWDDSAGALAWLTVGTGLLITGTTIEATGGGGGAGALNDLSDVTLASPAAGEILYFDGLVWVNDGTITVNSGTAVTVDDDLEVNGATGTGMNIVLNYDETGSPTLDAGIYVERGTSANAGIVWNETDDQWEIDIAGSTAFSFTNAQFGADTALIWADSDGETAFISKTPGSGTFRMRNEEAGGHIQIQAADSGGSNRTLIEGDPDGSTNLYHAGSLAATTTAEGFAINDTDSDDPTLRLRDNTSTSLALIQANNPSRLRIRSLMNGVPVTLEGADAGGIVRDLIVADPDGSVEQYFAGNVASKTELSGVGVYDTDGDSPFLILRDNAGTVMANLWCSSTNGVLLDQRSHGGYVRLRSEDNSGAMKDILWGDPDAALTLYYAGTRVLYVSNSNVQLFSTVDDNPYLAFYQDDQSTRNGYIQAHGTSGLIFTNDVHSGQMVLAAGLRVGSPSGGDQGAGTINAQAVYDDGTLLTDYVFDAELDGFVDEEKWHRTVPNRVRENGFVEIREHVPAALFAQRLDDLDPAAYAAKWRENRRLPAFDRNHGEQLSLGDYAQRLLETVEVQAVHIDRLRRQIEALEQRVAA